MSDDRVKATFAQFQAGAADLGTVCTTGQMTFAVVLIRPQAVYLAPLGTPLNTAHGEPGPQWTLMTDVSRLP